MSRTSSQVALDALQAFTADGAQWTAALDAEFVWYPLEEGHLPSYGLDGAQRVRDRWLASWEDHHIAVEQVAAQGEDVVTSVHVFGRGAGSGAPVDLRLHLHWKVREGKVFYLYEHAERAAALVAAGLPAEPPEPAL